MCSRPCCGLQIGAAPVPSNSFWKSTFGSILDDDNGHGALSRHLEPDDKILPLWLGFRDLLVSSVPKLSREPAALVSLDT